MSEDNSNAAKSASMERAASEPGVVPPGYNVTFLVHSDPTASIETPEMAAKNADRFAHTRTKRKRTSPQDFAILEAEYEKNARPDKAMRSSIVERVLLSDKEVQVRVPESDLRLAALR